ncbi:MAG: hypothetical protein KF754_08355 [Planctomycetes bacterium]|nr:hypothetical protein [Planctomycetota bacterium]
MARALCDAGWTAVDHGSLRVGVRQLEHDEEYWTEFEASPEGEQAAWQLVATAQASAHAVGITLTHESGPGGAFWRLKSGKLEFSPWIDRATLGDTAWTDVSKYLALFLRTFDQLHWPVLGFHWRELA